MLSITKFGLQSQIEDSSVTEAARVQAAEPADPVQSVLNCIFMEIQGGTGAGQGLVILKVYLQKLQVCIGERREDFLRKSSLSLLGDGREEHFQRQVIVETEGRAVLPSFQSFQCDAGCGEGTGQFS